MPIIPNSERTPEELKKITRKGGKASGVARRNKKLIKTLASEMVNAKIQNEELKALGEKLGLKGKFTLLELLIQSVSIRTIKKGTFQDLLNLQKLVGEEEKEEVTVPIININIPEPVEGEEKENND